MTLNDLLVPPNFLFLSRNHFQLLGSVSASSHRQFCCRIEDHLEEEFVLVFDDWIDRFTAHKNETQVFPVARLYQHEAILFRWSTLFRFDDGKRIIRWKYDDVMGFTLIICLSPRRVCLGIFIDRIRHHLKRVIETITSRNKHIYCSRGSVMFMIDPYF